MPLTNFPKNPTAGQTYNNNGTVWIFNGSKWRSSAASGVAQVYDIESISTGYFDLPSGNTAQRPGSPPTGAIRYNSTTGFAEVYTSAGWGSFGAQPPSISTVTPATYNGEAGTTFTINGANFTVDATVKFVDVNNVEYTAAVVTFVNSGTLTATTPQDFTVAQEPLDVKVIQVSGQVVKLDCIDCGGVPIWNTNAGSLATCYDNQRTGFYVDVSASDPDSSSTISYSVTSGTLPAGMSLNSNTGRISGTPNAVAGDTTSTFTLRASDNAGNNTDRTFSIIVKAPVVQAFTYTGTQQTFTVPVGLNSLEIYVWGAGGGGGSSSTGGSGGYAAGTLAVTGGTTYTVIVGGGGGGSSTMGWSGGGGGFSGLFTGGTALTFDSTGRARSIIIAGGGGGGSGGDQSEAQGGAGGGSSGNNGIADYRSPNPAGAGTRNGGGGGTQSAGGAIAPDTGGPYNPGNTAGSGLQGGVGSYSATAPNNGGFGGGGSAGSYSNGSYAGGGGGGGYYGGGGGQDYYSSAGGGGSGYVGGVTASTLTTGNDSNRLTANNPPNTGSAYYASGVGVGNYQSAGGHGRIVLRY